MSGKEDHPDAETIAILAEGGGRSAGEEELLAHLAVCPECRGAYAEAVRFRARWLSGPAPTSASPPVVSAARRIADGAAAEGGPVGPRRGGASPWTRRLTVALPLAAVLVLGIAALALMRTAWRVSDRAPGSDVVAALVPLLGEASRTGLVLPGAAGYVPDAGTLRGGDVPGGPAAETALEILTAGADQGRDGVAARRWLVAALLASGRLENARARLDEGRRSAPDDPGLQALEGALAYRESRLGDAESWLRKALAAGPGDSVIAFDLALVLSESGRQAEADRILGELHAPDGTLLARRLRELRGTD